MLLCCSSSAIWWSICKLYGFINLEWVKLIKSSYLSVNQSCGTRKISELIFITQIVTILFSLGMLSLSIGILNLSNTHWYTHLTFTLVYAYTLTEVA
jgi:hypothetical protein